MDNCAAAWLGPILDGHCAVRAVVDRSGIGSGQPMDKVNQHTCRLWTGGSGEAVSLIPYSYKGACGTTMGDSCNPAHTGLPPCRNGSDSRQPLCLYTWDYTLNPKFRSRTPPFGGSFPHLLTLQIGLGESGVDDVVGGSIQIRLDRRE